MASPKQEDEKKLVVSPLALPLGRGEVVPIAKEAHAVAFWSVAGPFLAPYPTALWPTVLDRQTTARVWWTTLLQTTLARVVGLSEPRCTLDLGGLRFPPLYASRFGNSMARYMFHLCKGYYERNPGAKERLTSRVSEVVQSGYALGPPPCWRRVPLTEAHLKAEGDEHSATPYRDALDTAFVVRPLSGCTDPGTCPCVGALDQGALRLALSRSFAGPRQAASLAVRAVVAAVDLGGTHLNESDLFERVPGLRNSRVVYSLCQREHRYCFPWLDQSSMHRNPDGTLDVHPLLRSHLAAPVRGMLDPSPLLLDAAVLPEPQVARKTPVAPAAGTDGALLAGTACLDCRAFRRNRSQCLALGHVLQPGCANETLVVFLPCSECNKKRRTLAGCLALGHRPTTERRGQKQKGGRRPNQNQKRGSAEALLVANEQQHAHRAKRARKL